MHIDPKVSPSYQQLSAKTYKKKGQRYDRGHLVLANHMDYSKLASMNRGAWLLTKEITKCYRDIDEPLIIGGESPKL